MVTLGMGSYHQILYRKPRARVKAGNIWGGWNIETHCLTTLKEKKIILEQGFYLVEAFMPRYNYVFIYIELIHICVYIFINCFLYVCERL